MSSFLPSKSVQRQVQPLGDKGAKIAIVGDLPDNFDLRSLRPFAGPPGSVLEQCLHAAGLIRGECYITTAVKDSMNHATFYVEQKNSQKIKSITPEGQAVIAALKEELDDCQANVIIACGNFSMLALTGAQGVHQYRGYVFETSLLAERRKVIPIYHPRDCIWGTYTRRHLISTDLTKAKREMDRRSLERPERQLIYGYRNVTEALEWLEYYETQERIVCDIEVINYAVSCISFSSDPSIACVIPIAAGWSEEEELMLWRGIQRVLGNPNSVKIFQNGIFDMQFLLAQNGVVVNGPVEDTMLAHSVCFPELPKGLGFLGSIYCGTQAYWKDKVNFNNIKDDS